MGKGIRIGILAAFFLCLLRIAIGWHFLYEGLVKLESFRNPSDERKPFDAGPFLASATGPLRRYYVQFVPDPYGLNKLDRDTLLSQWDAIVEEYRERYGLSEEQVRRVREKLDELRKQVDDFFADQAVQVEIAEYRRLVERIREHERRQLEQGRWVEWGATELTQLRSQARERGQQLFKWIDGWTEELRETLESVVTEEQRQKLAEQRPWWALLLVQWPIPEDPVQRISLGVSYGLTIIGGLMLVGLFSRLSSLGAALFLLSVYLAHPPWPGLPEFSPDGGHYMIVNKELIEAIAALSLACLPTGRWIGLDALIRGLITRRLQYKLTGKADDAIRRPVPQPTSGKTPA